MSEVKWEYAVSFPIAVKANPDDHKVTVRVYIFDHIAFEKEFEVEYDSFVTNGLKVSMDCERFIRETLIEWAESGERVIK